MLKKLPLKVREWVGLFIAARSHVAVQVYIKAGAEVLQREFDFTEEQVTKWAEATLVMGSKFLRLKDNATDGEKRPV